MNPIAVERTAPAPDLWRINLVGFWTIVRKESRRVVRIWVQTIVPPAITMTLYFIIFGSLVGSRIGQMDGVPYMTFIAPGLIMMAVITNSFANVVSSFFSSKRRLCSASWWAVSYAACSWLRSSSSLRCSSRISRSCIRS
jgi:ABC-2 type transporter